MRAASFTLSSYIGHAFCGNIIMYDYSRLRSAKGKWTGEKEMTYSIIGILAAIILLIINRDVLWGADCKCI